MNEAVDRQSGPRRYRTAILPFAILAGGLFLRLHGITAAADYEEYVCLAHIDASSLSEFIHRVRAEDPYIAPLPFILIYEWSRLAGTSPAAVRMLFVLFGMLVVGLMFLAGRRLGKDRAQGETIGLIAALCVAWSPVHAFHAQEVRHTTLLACFALCSMLCFLRGVRGGATRYWAGNLFFNLCVIWTHLLGGALLLAQGLCLLLLCWRQIRLIAAWGIAHALLVLPWLLWVASMPGGKDDPVVTFPLWDFLGRIISTDLVFFPHNLYLGRFPWERLVDALIALRAPGRWLWIFSGYLLLLATLWRAAKVRNTEPSRWLATLVLLLCFLVPPLVLYLLLFLGMPVYAHRYFIYSSLALYLLLGMGFASLRPPVFKETLGFLLLAVCAHNAALAILSPHRTQWSAAISLVESNRKPGESLVCSDFARLMCAFNSPAFRECSAAENTTDAMAERLQSLSRQTQRPLWMLRNLGSAEVMNTDLEGVLQARGLEATCYPYPGERWLEVWFVEPPFASEDRAEQERRQGLYWQAMRLNPKSRNAFDKLYRLRAGTGIDALALWQAAAAELPCSPWAQFYLGQSLESAHRNAEAAAAFRTAIGLDPRHSEFFEHITSLLIAANDPEAAITACRAGRDQPPYAARTALMLLGAVLDEAGRWNEAAEAYRWAIFTEPRARKAWMRYDAMLARTKAPAERVAAWRALNTQYPRAVWPAFVLGIALEDAGELPEATRWLAQASRAVPSNFEMADRLAMRLLADKDINGALAAWRGCSPLPPQHRPRVAALFCDAGNRLLADKAWAEAAAAFRAATEFEAENSLYWLRLGFALEAAADFEAALKAYREAAGRSPASVEPQRAIEALCNAHRLPDCAEAMQAK